MNEKDPFPELLSSPGHQQRPMQIGGAPLGAGNAPPVGGQNFFNDLNMINHSVTQDVQGLKEFAHDS